MDVLKVTSKIDDVANELQNHNPVLACALDMVSDKLERQAKTTFTDVLKALGGLIWSKVQDIANTNRSKEDTLAGIAHLISTMGVKDRAAELVQKSVRASSDDKAIQLLALISKAEKEGFLQEALKKFPDLKNIVK